MLAACCGTIATSNLLIQIDNDAGRTIKDDASNDDVQDEVEKETNDRRRYLDRQ